MITKPTHDDRLFDAQIMSNGGMAYADILVNYKEKMGITVLRRPAKATQSDMCIVYRPDYENGVVSGYKPVEMSNQHSALMGALAKGFLMTPMESQDEPLAVPAKVEDSVETHSDEPEEQSSLETVSVDSKPSDAVIEIFVCERKFANNKTCGREYKVEKFYLSHIRNKHSSSN